ncbi:hypothetical protein AG1IA_02162 [Rhizoctonia solani AG-1 IA]|uniref:Uncharacterized protein n=1 Tax=Thanatephorus cucumeris (strain AG1-IA) TaxID=983506 RepID=L8X0T8_THACA|nr:hypothetical protein AG1IA_02162 [Rhizoctonia solani AG-1 IA]
MCLGDMTNVDGLAPMEFESYHVYRAHSSETGFAWHGGEDAGGRGTTNAPTRSKISIRWDLVPVPDEEEDLDLCSNERTWIVVRCTGN